MKLPMTVSWRRLGAACCTCRGETVSPGITAKTVALLLGCALRFLEAPRQAKRSAKQETRQSACATGQTEGLPQRGQTRQSHPNKLRQPASCHRCGARLHDSIFLKSSGVPLPGTYPYSSVRREQRRSRTLRTAYAYWTTQDFKLLDLEPKCQKDMLALTKTHGVKGLFVLPIDSAQRMCSHKNHRTETPQG